MNNPIPQALFELSVHFVPDDAVGQWRPHEELPLSDFSTLVARRPFSTSLEGWPKIPQEVPMRPSDPMPDLSPRSGPGSPDGEETPYPTKHDSPARPEGKHDREEDPDQGHGPLITEDPLPEREPADEGGDIEEPGAQKPTPLVAGRAAAPAGMTPSDR